MTKRSKPRGAPREAPAFVWRKGVQIAQTSVWCDARRAQAICFLSSAMPGRQPAHQQLIATPATLALLGGDAVLGPGHLSVPYRKRFTLGTSQLELVPNGHGLGTAALYVKHEGKSVLYLGQPRVQPNCWGDAAEVRAVDALCIDVGDGVMAAPAPLAARVVDQLASAIAAARVPQIEIQCPSFMAAHEIAYGLAGHGISVRLPKAAKTKASPLVSLVLGARKRAKEPSCQWEVSAPLPLGVADNPSRFPWPTSLVLEDMLALVALAKPRALFFTGPGAQATAKLAPFAGKAHVLAPPWQMSLFS